MRKSDKKRDNILRKVLTLVCESALKDIQGFCWLTHIVNYDNFPKSLRIVCVFDSNADLDNYLLSDNNEYLQSIIASELSQIDIKLDNITNQILFDTEENCAEQHQGNWSRRLA
ncbi:Fis family transcriptional regulator [Planctobacterium marinum]|uniref:Fis family transcriptional regulator n=1 Tax=Planctobacterium marinum TaxID=1631968 RepID=A0AA48KQX6_9ALTE|nr:hypothetical protein MACH26_24540 [Planctobacterium marinum]